MILSGRSIEGEHRDKRISLEPFDPQHLTTNSYDLTLGSAFIRYTDLILDTAKPPNFETIDIGAGVLTMKKGEFLLGHSVEVVGSDHFVPIIHARSGIARLGLFIHVTADLIDIGSIGNITFQLYSTLPITLAAGMKIAQVSFWQPQGEITLYEGKYKGSIGPNPSQVYKDFSHAIDKMARPR